MCCARFALDVEIGEAIHRVYTLYIRTGESCDCLECELVESPPLLCTSPMMAIPHSAKAAYPR
jgi:hypothetical protein